MSTLVRFLAIAVLAFAVSGCGGGGLFKKILNNNVDARNPSTIPVEEEETFFDLFTNADNPNVTIGVNKYIWNATLDVLSFLPIEGADPFSGVIVMGWGRASGSSRSYRATVYIQDPALDARSLRVALVSRAGPANRDTVRAIEDAILTRARQLRIRDSKL